jgi:hypothetical protein
MIVLETARCTEKNLTADYADSTDKSFKWILFTPNISRGKTSCVIREIRGRKFYRSRMTFFAAG